MFISGDDSSGRGGIGQTQMEGQKGWTLEGVFVRGHQDWSVDIHSEDTGQNSKTWTTAKRQTDRQRAGGRGPQTCMAPCL